MTHQLDELIAEAELGEEAKRFLESDLGKVILGLSQQETDRAREELDVADPNDPVKIRQLQNEIKFAKLFEQWLRELLADGENAISVFKQQDQQ